MKVGLDAYTLRDSKLDIWQLLERVSAHRLEGMQISCSSIEGLDARQVQRLTARAADSGLYLELAGPSVNPVRTGRTAAEIVAEWRPLFALASTIGARIINTSFGLLKERCLVSPSLTEQIYLTTQVLRELASVGEVHGVAVTLELHVDLTSFELLRVIKAVDSPYVAVNLDTANACGLMEDPVEVAELLAPFVRTAHLKDTCVYPVDGGYNWQGGSVLGRGVVDLSTIVDILYRANPEVNLNIEDSGGYLHIPIDDPVFFDTLTELTPRRVLDFHRLLARGEKLVRAGLQPTPDESKRMNWKDVIEGRLELNAEYARRLRDDVVARYQADV